MAGLDQGRRCQQVVGHQAAGIFVDVDDRQVIVAVAVSSHRRVALAMARAARAEAPLTNSVSS